MSTGIDYLRDAVAYAEEVSSKARVRGGFRLWNRPEGVQIDLGASHAIVPWIEIENAPVNVLRLRMDEMIEQK